MDRLNEALERHSAEIGDSLQAAYDERDQLQTLLQKYEAAIEQAEAVLGVDARRERLTLHEAMAVVLREGGNEWMTTRELADEVNRRDLYRKRDGSPVESNQIHARAKNYSHMFDKDRQLVRLREGEQSDSLPQPLPRSKYDALRDWLLTVEAASTTMTFDEVAEFVGPLPPSAWRHQAWWANEAAGNHVQARSWLSAGFRVDGVDQNNGWVRFRRDRGDEGVAGVREPRTPRPDSSFDEIRIDLPDEKK